MARAACGIAGAGEKGKICTPEMSPRGLGSATAEGSASAPVTERRTTTTGYRAERDAMATAAAEGGAGPVGLAAADAAVNRRLN